MNESIVKLSFTRFKRNISSYIAVGIMCCLFLVLVASLSFLNEFAFLLAIPLIGLPTLFACHIACYLLEVNQNITVGAFARYYASFFRPQFRSSFRGIVAFLLSLAVSFCLGVISAIAMYLAFKAHFGDTFVNAFNGLVEKYMSGITLEELNSLLKENDGLLLTFVSFVASIPLPFAIVAFIVVVSFNSISLYYRANITSGAPSLIRLGIANAYRANKKKMIKDWLTLNWWLIVLPLVGCLASGLICVFGTKSYSLLAPYVTVGAFIPLVFFLPFYFPNMEVLYHRYENVFKEGNKMAIESLLERIQTSLELSEEEKRNLEESFRENNEDKE